MAIIIIKPNEEYEIENKGKITILSYKDINEAVDNLSVFGADMIFKFDPFDSFGKSGDTVTFVQIVADDFSYIKPPQEKPIYTWSMNKQQDFALRNYKADGIQCDSKDIPLNYSIDQYVNVSVPDFPYNCDYRYPENRIVETLGLSYQEQKAEDLLNKIKEGKLSPKEFNLEELYNGNFKTFDEQKAELIRRLNCDKDIVPYVVYSAAKRVGKWQPGRMSDSPRTKALKGVENIQGSQHFETLLMYNDKSSKKLSVLCTVYWGWTIDTVDGHAKIFDIECKEELPMHWLKAVEQWNKYEEHGFKIPNIEV